MNGSALTCGPFDEGLGAPVITQSSHAFVVGDVLYESADGTYAKAKADSESTFKNGLGICAHVTDTNTFVLWRPFMSRRLTWTHGKGTPTFGEDLFLSDSTAGDTSTTPGAFSVRLGYIVSATEFQWEAGTFA